jgi:predicted metalloprotease with PDZ domain
MKRKIFLTLAVLSTHIVQAQKDTVYFEVNTSAAAAHTIGVSMTFTAGGKDITDLRMPAWSPGYYQLMHYGKTLKDFKATGPDGKILTWQLMGNDVWRIATKGVKKVQVQYHIQTERAFVATSYINEERAFIKPTATFLGIDGALALPAVVTIPLDNGWTRIATGLDSTGRSRYLAKNFDILYDCPILVGNLQELPPFKVKGKAHRFIGYKMGTFDGAALMKDLEKIVTTASNLIGDIPYEHYTFIATGPGAGGIEQLNSTAIGFSGEGLNNAASRNRMLSFLAHEYFHHYNIKRIRPIELGPFDYSKANRTNSLWVGEGLTVYYESLILNRAGLIGRQEVIDGWRGTIQGFENNAGRKKQTLAQSSANTWEDGPFGKRGETISFYEKGPIVGLLLDIEIRVASGNKKSLDDVMRYLYNTYYKTGGRGFTETEVKAACEQMAGTSLDELFDYIYTLKEIDYKKYLSKAGLVIDLTEDKNQKGETITKVTLAENTTLTALQQTILNSLLK